MIAEWHTVARVARGLGVDVATVRRWASRGEIPAIRVGHTWRIDPRYLETVRGSSSARVEQVVALLEQLGVADLQRVAALAARLLR